MPLYEYHCSKCGKNFDVLQRFSDAPLTTHEECGGAAERVLSAPAFQFKGSGWYVTDYGKGGKKPGGDGPPETKPDDAKAVEAKADSKSEPPSEGKSEPKSESKSDSGAERKSASKPESKSDAVSKAGSKPPAKSG
jgi:putative FmdB family regulatory protein